MAFGRLKHCGPLLKRFHAMRERIEREPEPERIWKVYDWLVTPFMLWPHEYEDMAKKLLDCLEAGDLDADFRLFLEYMEGPPPATAERLMAATESDMEKGRHDQFLKQKAKFSEGERTLLEDAGLREFWNKIKARFDVAKYQNSRGVVRRRVTGERNFREGWQFKWSDDRGRFQELLDALCYRWNLYGMEKDQPLLLKVTVTPTAHGTLIFIPRNLSFDPKRDLDWKLIARLHRCRVKTRQGPKLSSTRIEKLEEAKEAKRLWAEAEKNGKKGEARYDYVRERMKRDPRAGEGWLWRLLRRKS
jgi:hypothetical protein